MEITLTVNGKQVKATVDEHEMKEAMRKEEKITGYLPVECKGYYFVENCCGEIHEMPLGKNKGGNKVKEKNVGNFYSLRKVAEDNARADALRRNLRAFAAIRGGCISHKHFFEEGQACELFFDNVLRKPNYRDSRGIFGSVIFRNGKDAQEAIDEFWDDLLWYFTEYDPMPEGWWKNDQSRD